MSVSVVETNDPLETEALGAELAAGLRDGDVVLVRGELGSGKTTFVRGAARALGVTDPITSPTFSIGHRYRAAQTTVSHLDLYRLADGLQAEDPACWMTIWVPGGSPSWSGRSGTAPSWRDARVRVTLAHMGEDRRRVEVVQG